MTKESDNSTLTTSSLTAMVESIGDEKAKVHIC